MARTYTKQELQDQYEKLPDALKDAIFSTEVAEKIFETGKKHGLTIEKIGFLAEETGRVILGLTRPNKFVSLLAERLAVPADAAQKIASDINHQIFFPLREALRSAHEIDVGESAMQKSTAVDLRSLARPQAAPPPAAPATPLGTAKVPPIDLRRQEERPLVDIEKQKPPTPALRPANFLTREEVEKAVAEKRAVPPHKPPQPVGDTVYNLETRSPSIPTAEAKKDAIPASPAPPPAPPRSITIPQSVPAQPQKLSTPAPQSSPQAVPLPKLPDVECTAPIPVRPGPRVPLPKLSDIESTIPMGQSPKSAVLPNKAATSATGPQIIDLRKDTEIQLEFKPPPPIAPRQAPQALEKPTSAPAPPPAPTQSKIPPIDLRQAPKPWSGTDPYRESPE